MSSSLHSSSFFVLGLILTAAGCVSEEAAGEVDDVGAEAEAEITTLAVQTAPGGAEYVPPSDPATAVENVSCLSTVEWNGTFARLHYPSNGGCGASVMSPLVVIMPGHGFAIADYDYLGRHLARNGFIVGIVDPVAGFPAGASNYQAAADEAWDFVVDFMWSTWSKRSYINPRAVGLVGHSRGGEAVRYLADTIASDPTFDVQAVVGLATTDHTSKFVGSGDAIAALYLHGNSDGDVPLRRGVRAYDNTGTDVSQNDPGYNPAVLDRTFKLLVTGDHFSFTSHLEGGGGGDKPAQRAAAQGYVLAFLKAHLEDDFTYYADYIRGDAVPGGWTNDVFTQTADGFYSRVIDNFENGLVTINTLGKSVLRSSNVAWSIEDLGLDNLVAHDTLALSATASGGAGWVEWHLPAGKRDASGFRWFSIRIGRRGATGDGGVTVQLLNDRTWSDPVALESYGLIAEELLTCADNPNPENPSPGCFGPLESVAHMSTIRVLLAKVGEHNAVRAVRLNIEGDSVGDELLLDSLAFSEAAFVP